MSSRGITGAQPDQTAPIVLALEASGDLLSVALWADGKIQAHRSQLARHGHAALITPMIRSVMDEGGMSFSGLTHIAAGRGPGSFTGIRVALATAKGLCLATGAKGLGISGLAALAAHLRVPEVILISAETRRGPFYGQFFDKVGQAITPIFESDLADIATYLPADVARLHVAGWQAGAIAKQLQASRTDLEVIPVDGAALVDAACIAEHAEAMIRAGHPADEMTPLYLAPAFLGPQKQATQ